MSAQLTAAINSLTIEDLDSFQSFMELLKSKKKSLQSEKAKAVRAEAAAIKQAEKEEKKAEADRKKKEQALLDSKLSKIESEVRSVFKLLLNNVYCNNDPGTRASPNATAPCPSPRYASCCDVQSSSTEECL